jgi:hypothetical protein
MFLNLSRHWMRYQAGLFDDFEDFLDFEDFEDDQFQQQEGEEKGECE